MESLAKVQFAADEEIYFVTSIDQLIDQSIIHPERQKAPTSLPVGVGQWGGAVGEGGDVTRGTLPLTT